MFQVDPRIENESLFLGELKISNLYLCRDEDLPWFILVPRVEAITEFFQLKSEDQILLINEINFISKLLKRGFNVDKINIGMLGNVVSQLHVHLVGRFKDDRLFPSSVWGHRKELPEEKIREKYGELLNKLINSQEFGEFNLSKKSL